MASDKLKKINNEIKDYINESNFISIKTRNKIIKTLGDEFDIKFKSNYRCNYIRKWSYYNVWR